VLDKGSVRHNGIMAPIGVMLAAFKTLHLRFSVSATALDGCTGEYGNGRADFHDAHLTCSFRSAVARLCMNDIVGRVVIRRNSASRGITAVVEAGGRLFFEEKEAFSRRAAGLFRDAG
jgi:hypothetical protein